MPAPPKTAALDAAIDSGLERLGAATTAAERKAALQAIHDDVMIETRYLDKTPHEKLARLGKGLAEAPADGVDSLPMRVRVVIRLLRAGAYAAAWVIMSDSAADQVKRSGAPAGARGTVSLSTIPMTTRIESGTVYAWLPGFRDPRYAAAKDDCYDMTDRVVQRSNLDDATLHGDRLTLSGWTSLAYFDTCENEQVTVTLTTREHPDVIVPAQRRRRPDLVKGTGEGLTRRAWAGWSTEVDLSGIAKLGSATWDLSVTIERDGIARTTALAWDAKSAKFGDEQSSRVRHGRRARLIPAPGSGKLRLEVGQHGEAGPSGIRRVRRRLSRAYRRAIRTAGGLREKRVSPDIPIDD